MADAPEMPAARPVNQGGLTLQLVEWLRER